MIFRNVEVDMSLDTELTLDMMRARLRWLEHEMSALKRLVDQVHESQPQPRRSFESLEGIWEGVIFSEEEYQSARNTESEDI